MKYLVGVSGGIDSVVLLDLLVHKGEHELIVAHFDHGIRPDSASDARFVRGLAEKYGLPFVTRREELGYAASEELARDRRYAFLREEATKAQATIVTAHHADDGIETVAINIIRGTGWRGLAVLEGSDILRPLLRRAKSDLRIYALVHRLEWVEDSTNAGAQYLRNRVRRAIASSLSPINRQAVLDVWQQQLLLRQDIDNELAAFMHEDSTYSRYFFIMIDPVAAQELLRAAIFAKRKTSPTRPQMERALIAIKTAQANTKHEVGAGTILYFTARSFIVKTP
jgi:tRNA(Ile)-lysidine synthase